LIITKWKIAGELSLFGRDIPAPTPAPLRNGARFNDTNGIANFALYRPKSRALAAFRLLHRQSAAFCADFELLCLHWHNQPFIPI